jgi:Sulfotransferase family
MKCLSHPTHFSLYRRSRKANSPVFIVGCGHSGTSLLLAILGAHSKLCAIPQESCIAYSYQTRAPGVNPDAKFLLKYFDLLAIAEKKMRWVEKTPKQIYSIALLRKLVPGCKFIIILRDGRDVACSLAARYGSLEDAIKRWVEDNEAGDLYAKDADVHVLKYEDIIDHFDEALGKALTFLGENFEEDLQQNYQKPKFYYSRKIERPPDESPRHHAQYRNWQINQKIFDGRGKWKQLSDAEKQTIKTFGGEMLAKYGYVTDQNW